jgi:undecaprenyl-diphosphatase
MPLIQVIVLGLVQGVTEFLPVSSSGHLILVSWLAGWPDQGLSFDVALHVGTLLAVGIYFLPLWLEILFRNRRLLGLLVVGVIPGAVIGKLFEKMAEHTFRNPIYIAINLIVFGLLMGLAERVSRRTRDLHSTNMLDALAIGFGQALAVIPGVSRSGITLTCGLFREFDREAAARFSFLLATPIIAGAALVRGFELRHVGIAADMRMPFLLGMAIAAVSGYAVIAFFMRYLQTQSLKIFVYYRVAFGIIVLALAILSRLR